MQRKEWLSVLKQKISRFMTKRNQCILFLVTMVLVAASIYAAVTDSFPEPVSISLYALAAIGFVSTITLWVKAILLFFNVVLLPFTRNNRIANTLITDTRLRTVLMTLPGMGLNLIYAVFNGVIGVMGRSAWYGSLAAYYFLLCIMRFLSVSYAGRVYEVKVPWRRADASHPDGPSKKELSKEEQLEIRAWKVHRNCGVLFCMISIALGGAVIVLVSGEGGKSYPGLMIYAAATYTFYKLGMAIRNMIRAQKEKSLLLVTLRDISYADALVSLLSLQTALFAAFGQDSGAFVPLMNALTGAGVCLMILALGIYMIHKSKKEYR